MEFGWHFATTVTFAEQGNKTRVSVRMPFESATERDRVVKKFGAIEGLNQPFGRLEELLARK